MQITNNSAITSASNNSTINSGNTNQDKYIKSLQGQIENVKKQLQSLSENKKMSPEEKMERRKVLQQQIQDLNNQIAQRKLEIRQEKLAAAQKGEKRESQQNSTVKEDDSSAIEAADMQEMINADFSMKQVEVLHSSKTNLEGKSRVLKKEIEFDLSTGGPTEKKEAELIKIKDHISAAAAGSGEKIADINEGLEEAADVQDGIRGTQGEAFKEDTLNTNTEKNKVGQPDVPEQKDDGSDKAIGYTKTGEATHRESESKLSMLV